MLKKLLTRIARSALALYLLAAIALILLAVGAVAVVALPVVVGAALLMMGLDGLRRSFRRFNESTDQQINDDPLWIADHGGGTNAQAFTGREQL